MAEHHLTRRERDVARLLAEGLSNRDIATRLVVRPRSIAKMVSSIMRKLDVANRTQASHAIVAQAQAKARVRAAKFGDEVTGLIVRLLAPPRGP